MAEQGQPFILAVMLHKDYPGRVEYGVRGGFHWAPTLEQAKGELAAMYLEEGYSIDILDVKPMSVRSISEIVEYAGRQALADGD